MATADLSRTPRTEERRSGSLRRLASETKASFKTSELYVMVVVAIATLIAANSIEGEEGGRDFFTARQAWLYVTILAAAYMVSRGLAKSGSRDPYWQTSGDNHSRDDEH
jgi:hypothetical protein